MLDDNGETCFVMFNKGPTNGGFVKVAPNNILSAALHPDNANKEKLCVRNTITVDSVDDAVKRVQEAGGALYM